MRVLVAVASRHGSTARMGGVVADELRRAGLEVTQAAPGEVDTLAGHDAVVLGSAVYTGRWLPEATGLVDRLAPELADRPVWLLSSGPLGDPPHPLGDPAGVAGIVERVGPRDHRVFAGRLDRGGLGLGERAIMRMVGAPDGDFRDWVAVRGWARAVAASLAGDVPAVAGTP